MLHCKRVKVKRFDKNINDPSIPSYLQASYGPFVIKGYRGEISWKEAIQSIGSWHNESFNIWSHMIGGLLFLTQMIVFNSKNLAINIYQTSVVTLLFTSATAHTFCALNRKTYYKMWKVDFSVVSITMWSQYLVWCRLIFPMHVAWSYLTLSGAISVSCIYFSMCNKFADAKYRYVVPSLFSLLGGIGILPIIHACIYYNNPYVVKATYLTIVKLICSFIGFITHVYRIPERFAPGIFDYVGNGHNIMHLLILVDFELFLYTGFTLLQNS